MYIVDNALLKDFIMGDARHFTAVMSFRNGTVLSEEICTLDLSKQTNADDLMPGDVISASLSGTLSGLSDTILGQTFILSFFATNYGGDRSTYQYLSQYTYEYLHNFEYGAMPGTEVPEIPIPMGEFRVSSCLKQDDLWSFEAHDLLYASDKPYNSGLRYPAPLAQVEHELCNSLGIAFRDNIEQITIRNKPTDTTCREMLGYIAALFGKICITDRLGKLAYKGLDETGYIIEPDRAAEPETSQSAVRITSLHCGDLSAAAPGAADRDITFEDPYMTAEYFENVKGSFLGFAYTPLSIEHIMGDPRFDLLDLVTVRKADGDLLKIPLMSLALEYDGGISCTLAATASDAANYDAARTNRRPLTDQIRQLQEDVETSEQDMQDAVDYITGANGGYVITQFNADGQPIATYYTDNLDPAQASNIIRINQNGILGTNGGMNGQYMTAITNDGRINASRILTGILKAIIVQSTNFNAQNGTGSKLDLNDGTFSFAGGKLKFENNVLSAENLTVTNAEIVDGSINVTTSDAHESRIELKSSTVTSKFSPYEVEIKAAIGGNKVSLSAFTGLICSSGNGGASVDDTGLAVFDSQGDSVAIINTAGTGRFKKLYVLGASGNTYDVGAVLDQLLNS